MIGSRVAAFLAVLWLASGCTTISRPDLTGLPQTEPARHLLYIDAEGDLIDPDTRAKLAPSSDKASICSTVTSDEKKEQCEKARDRYMEQISELQYVRAMIHFFLSKRKQNPKLEPVFHIHGGLNTFNGVVERARLLPRYMLSDDRYPFLIGWPSGFARSYWHHLSENDRGRERNVGVRTVIGAFTFMEDIARSIVRFPGSFYRQISNMLSVSVADQTREERDVNARLGLLEMEGKIGIVSPPSDRGVGSTYLPSILNPLGWMATPFRDGLGPGAWDAMLRQSDLVLTKTSAYQGLPTPVEWMPEDLKRIGVHPSDTAATIFLREWQSNQETKAIPVTIIGHSMGAIVVLNLLSRHPTLRAENIVFMGAAARVKDVESVLTPWLAHNRLARFYNLSLDPYNEIAERSYWDSAPRGSLLIWIDDSIGTINSFRDRVVGKWWNVVRVADDLFPANYLARMKVVNGGSEPEWKDESVNIRSRVTLKRFAIDRSGDSGPQTHGAFDDYCFWRPSFWTSSDPQRPLFKEVRSGSEDLTFKESCLHPS
ncbi:MAG: alpha/beta hydrolase [Burkholderiaceae bacterium]